MRVIVMNIDVNMLASSVIHIVYIIPEYTFNFYVVDINLNILHFSCIYIVCLSIILVVYILYIYIVSKYIVCLSNNPSICTGNLPWHTQIDKNNYIIPAYLFQLTLSVIPYDLSNST